MNRIFSPPRLILLTGIVLIIVTSNINWGKNRWKSIIENDAKAYYAYLPAVFIYHDLNFSFFGEVEQEYFPDTWFDYRKDIGGKKINKYYCGTAIAEMPFFLTVWLFYHNDGTRGWGKPYMLAISLAAIFYLLVGLWFTMRLLRLYKIPDKIISLVLVAAVFGTHLFYYTIGEPGMSHVYSFAFVSMFLYLGKRTFLQSAAGSWQLAAALSFTILIRPVNGLIILILPFLAGNTETLLNTFRAYFGKPVLLFLSILIFLTIILPQLIIYRIASGNFFIYAYNNEGFNFREFNFFSMLFSFRKGLFLYTPLLLVSLLGLIPLWKQNRFKFFSLLAFLFILNYILSSWWMWWYGGSFSSRVYVEYIPVFILLLGILFAGIQKPLVKRLFTTFVILLTVFCQLQTYQYRKGAIHWDSMTKEKYRESVINITNLLK